jgi:DNA-binding MarR family transcriptional regulator
LKREKTIDYHIKAAWLAISRMYNAQAAKYDMTMAIGYVLLNIDAEKGTPATKIAPLLGLEARSLTRMLKTLEEKEWIYRLGSATDKRYVNIYLTAKGKDKRELARKTVIDFNQQINELISADRLALFFDVIKEINAIVENRVMEEKLSIEEKSEI